MRRGMTLLLDAAGLDPPLWGQGQGTASSRGSARMVDLVTLKAEARTAAFAARKQAFAAGQGQAAEIAGRFSGGPSGQALAGYMPMRTEIDPLAAMTAHQGAVGVPVILGPGQALKFREWTPGCAMVEGAFGALYPG